ncbi:hypothetical protein AYK26_01575 [Euryarchaeota archaeon SM23-78]|nr:MAG: hypothetical protein AYK26_01575 [Euryarchaeota archaeon SM23-78]MBW3000443.1 hypothetical protein [Candidatus Woesearchaeota archaeon]
MKPKLTPELAEIVGIMMGDGCLYLDRLNKYQTVISFNKDEKDYLVYVKNLFENYFDGYKFCITETKDELLLRNTSVFVGKQLEAVGICVGNKIKNKITLPFWIYQENISIIRFLRGFFDTDGCVYRKYDNFLQVQFKLACEETLSSVYKLLVQLGFHPSRIQRESNKNNFSWKFYLCRQSEIRRFFQLFSPKNLKHVKRYLKMKK